MHHHCAYLIFMNIERSVYGYHFLSFHFQKRAIAQGDDQALILLVVLVVCHAVAERWIVLQGLQDTITKELL